MFTFRKDSLFMRMLLAGRNKTNFFSYSVSYQSDGISFARSVYISRKFERQYEAPTWHNMGWHLQLPY